MNKVKFGWDKIILTLLIIILIYNMTQVTVAKQGISFLVCVTFFLNIFMSIILIFKEKKSYTLYKTYWYFSLIFLGLAPFNQYLSNCNLWHYVLQNSDYLKGNMLVLFANIIFLIVYELKSRNYLIKNKEYYELTPSNIKIKTTPVARLLLIVVLIMCVVFSVKNVGFLNLFSRAENEYNFISNSVFNTIFSLLCRGIPVYIFYIFFSQNNKLNIISIICLGVILILNFPTSTTRFWMGAIYIGIFLIMWDKKNKIKRRYDILLLVIFSLIFPLLFAFKFYDIQYFIEKGFQIKTLTDSYNSVDYDAYSIIPRGITYVDENGIVYGKQFLGTLLFIVPRQIWVSKPYPTGDLIAKAQNQKYTNISCPFMMEGYINFGILGVIMFQTILGIVSSKFDCEYWYNEKCNHLLRMLYPFLMGFWIYLLRGALHPVIVYLFCFCLPLIVIKFLISGGKNDIKNI